MILNETYHLSNNIEIPKLGLRTWFINNKDAAGAVREAVKLGYRLIDTAQAYNNEAGVGEGIRTCGVSREELFVTSKIAAEAKSYADAKKPFVTFSVRQGLIISTSLLFTLLNLRKNGVTRLSVISAKILKSGVHSKKPIKRVK